MIIKNFVFNMFGVNTYVVWDETTRETMIVDPGMTDAGEEDILYRYIETNHLNVTHIVNTHMHLDHIFGDHAATGHYGLPVEAHMAEAPFGTNLEAQARQFGIRGQFQPQPIGKFLNEGDVLKIGDDAIRIIHIPGHSPGSIALYSADNRFIISGDVIFPGSIGRTDLAMGDHALLIAGIRKKLMTLPSDTVIYPGHGNPTTVEAELRSNPYI